MLIKCRFCKGEFLYKHFKACPKCVKLQSQKVQKGLLINIKV